MGKFLSSAASPTKRLTIFDSLKTPASLRPQQNVRVTPSSSVMAIDADKITSAQKKDPTILGDIGLGHEMYEQSKKYRKLAAGGTKPKAANHQHLRRAKKNSQRSWSPPWRQPTMK